MSYAYRSVWLFQDLGNNNKLAIAMQTFIAILQEIAKIDDAINRNEDLTSIIDLLSFIAQNLLGFGCKR